MRFGHLLIAATSTTRPHEDHQARHRADAQRRADAHRRQRITSVEGERVTSRRPLPEVQLGSTSS